MTTEILTQFCKRKDVVWLEMLHQIGHSWGPAIVEKLYDVGREAGQKYRNVMAKISIRDSGNASCCGKYHHGERTRRSSEILVQ